MLVPGVSRTSRGWSGCRRPRAGARLHPRAPALRTCARHAGPRPPRRRAPAARWRGRTTGRCASPPGDPHGRRAGRQAGPRHAARRRVRADARRDRRSAPSTPPSTPIARRRLAEQVDGATRIPIPLDVIECWDRNVAPALEQDVLRLSTDGHRGDRRDAAARLPEAPPAACCTTARAARSRKALGRYPHVDVARRPVLLRSPRRPAGRHWPTPRASSRLRRRCGSSSWAAAAWAPSSPCSWSRAATTSSVIDKNPEAFVKYPPGDRATTIVGLGFDRDVLEEAGIKEAEAFVAVSSGDNSNIVSARVALEHYHVPKVVARIYDPRRAEIYERLNIPTVATTKWGVRADPADAVPRPQRGAREPSAAATCCGCACRCRRTWSASRRPTSTSPGKIMVAGVRAGGGGFIPSDGHARCRTATTSPS